MKLFAIAIVAFSFRAVAEDHSAPPVVAPAALDPGMTVINVAPPDARPDELELVGTIQTEVTTDPNWVSETVKDIQSRYGEQAPETLAALESALSNIAAGRSVDGMAGEIASELVEAGTKAAGNAPTMEERLERRAPVRVAANPPRTVALQPIQRSEGRSTQILQKTDELSYKSPRMQPVAPVPALVIQAPFPFPTATEVPDVKDVRRVGAVRPQPLYKSAGISADAATAPVSSNGGVTVSTGPGVVNLVPGSPGASGASRREVAGALFRAMRGEKVKGVFAGEIRTDLAPAPAASLDPKAMEKLQDLFKAPSVKRAAIAVQAVARTAVRPPQLDERQLRIYYGAMAFAWLATLGYVIFLLRKMGWMGMGAAKKRSSTEPQEEEQAA